MRNNKTTSALFVALAIAAAALMPAGAICPTARLITTDQAYIYTPGVCDTGYPCPGDGSVSENLKGVFWVVGAGDPAFGTGNDNGSFAARQQNGQGYYLSGFVTNYPGYPAYLGGSWGQSQAIDGCPDFVAAPGSAGLCTALLLSDQVGNSGYYMLQSVENDSAGNYRFQGGALSPIDREAGGTGMPGGPVISSVVRLGSSGLEVTVNPPSQSAIDQDLGCPEVYSGYRVWTQVLPRDAPPPADRDPSSGWVVQGGAVDGPATVQVDCEQLGNADVYIASSLVFDSGFETGFLSANSSTVECGVIAADVEPLRPRLRPGQKIELKRTKDGGRR